MAVKVLIPSQMRNLTQGAAEVDLDAGAGTVQDVLKNLDAKYAGFGARIRDDQGNLRRFLNVYVNEEDIRFLQGETTAVKAGDTISIVPAIAGGVEE